MDHFFASSLETESFQSVEILAAHLPVEYGYASGGVIHVVTKSGLGKSWRGELFSGTHFGHPRLMGARVRLSFPSRDE